MFAFGSSSVPLFSPHLPNLLVAYLYILLLARPRPSRQLKPTTIPLSCLRVLVCLAHLALLLAPSLSYARYDFLSRVLELSGRGISSPFPRPSSFRTHKRRPTIYVTLLQLCHRDKEAKKFHMVFLVLNCS